MSCSCKHSREEIKEFYKIADGLRELFIKRMTVDSGNDRRKKDFNQSIFLYLDEDETRTTQCFCEMDMDMVLDKFDQAVCDYRRTFCDDKNCRRSRRNP